ncbi:MAG: AMIN-like domain-containing (lipo)protein, partial [Candidatus Limnocylindria bacterium]
MSRSRRLLTATLLVLTACMPSASSPIPGVSESPPSASLAASGEPSALGSAEATDSETPSGGLPGFVCDLPITGAASIGLAHLADVRVSTHAGYDRIVFEFMEDGTPEFRIEA